MPVNYDMKSSFFAPVLMVSLLVLSACDKREAPPASVDAVPSASLPATVAPAPPAPSPDEQLRNELAKIGGLPTDQGWTLLLPSAKFNAREVTFDAADSERVSQIAALVKNSLHVRILVTVSEDDRGPRSRRHSTAQTHAEAVRSTLSADGADASRIQAQGSGDEAAAVAAATRHDSRVALIVSNATGEFPVALPAGS